MKKVIIVLVVLVGLAFAYWTISPLFITNKVNERLVDLKQANQSMPEETIAQGNFVGLGGHSAEGKSRLIKLGDKYYVRFEDDFKVTNGPDLFVYFGKDNKYDPSTKLGSLKGNVGSQNYEVPSVINPNNYDEVWVWCRAFFVPFGKAQLK